MTFQFQPGQSWFHRIDPISKFIWLASVSAAALFNEEAQLQWMLFLAVAVTGMLLGRLYPLYLLRGLRLPIYFGIPYFVLQLLFIPGQTVIARVGFIVLTAESLDYAAAVSLRLLTLVLASLVYIATTDPRDVVLALSQQLKIPYRFAFAVAIALRFLPVLETEAALIQAASRLRGFGKPKGIRLRITAWKRYAAAVFLNAVRRIQTTAYAMDSRAFGRSAERTYLRRLRISAAGVALSVLSGISAVLFLIWV